MPDRTQDIQQVVLTSRNKYRALVDGFQDHVFAIDSGMRILSLNIALADSFNTHPRELIGQPCYHLLYGFDQPCPEMGLVCPAIEAMKSHQAETAFHELPDPDAPERIDRYIEISATPLIEEKDGSCEVILTRRDITSVKKAQIESTEYSLKLETIVKDRTKEIAAANRELRVHRNQLEATNQELLKMQHLKEDLTNMVIHDMKGPLSEIQANLEMLLTEPLSEYQGEYLEAAQMGSNELLRMITNLLDISRMEEDRLVLDPEHFSLRDAIMKAITRYEALARLKNIDVSIDIDPELSDLYADQQIFERVMGNILSNALDYTPDSGRVEVRGRMEGSAVRIEVDDNGPGIPKEFQEKIFEKFLQGAERS